MYLLHTPSNSLVEVLNPPELWNPFMKKVAGRFHAGEELQEQELFTKSHLAFLSGEALPQCWIDANYRHRLANTPPAAMNCPPERAPFARHFAY